MYKRQIIVAGTEITIAGVGRKMAGWLLLLVCSWLIGGLVYAQPIENHFTHYTTRDGLAEGAIVGITRDSTGFLWLASQNGLCRFDGYNFKVYRYNQADTSSLRENGVCGIFIDAHKRLWVVTAHWLHLFHADGEWFEHFNVNSFSADALNKICFEDNDRLIIVGAGAMRQFDMKLKKFSFYNQDVYNEKVADYKKDEDGIEWLATEHGLLRYDPKTKARKFINALSAPGPNSVINIILLSNGYLLASTYANGLILLNRHTGIYKSFITKDINPMSPLEIVNPVTPANDRMDCTYKLNDSIILCSCSGGLSVFNWLRQTFTYFKPDKIDPTSMLESDTRIHSIYRDKEGIIWLGGEYLEKYDYRDYKIRLLPSFDKEYSKRFAKFYDLYRCANGTFVMGCYTSMAIYDPVKDALVNNDYKDTLRRTNYFTEDGRGNVWCYTQPQRSISAFCIRDNKVYNIRRYYIPQPLRAVYDMKLDSKGRILLATEGAGMVVFDTGKKTFTYINTSSTISPRLTSSCVTALCEDHAGCIWVGTQNGINKIQQDGITVKQYSQNKKGSKLQTDWHVNDIKEDKHGIIWFTTNEHGIGRIDPITDSVRLFSTAQGLPTCYFDVLCIDDQDNLWALSRMGILNLNVVTLQNKLYTEEEGFPLPGDINTIHYSSYTRKLYILTPYSIYEIDAKNAQAGSTVPQTSITGFSVFDKVLSVAGDNGVTLQYNENFVNIQFACLLFHSNKQIKYAYKMDGIDNDWVYCNYTRSASYTNLPPGNYTFNVKAQNAEGVWNNAPTKLHIIIQPPFWETWWFYTLEAIALLALIFWVVRFYTTRKLSMQRTEFEKIRAVSNERMRIASDMHDDLGAGLTSIRLLSEIANLKTGNDSAAKSEIEKIVRSADSLSENLREIIWTMNTRFDKLEDFIIYTRSYAVAYFDDIAVDFSFHKPGNIPDLKMSGELRRNLFLCIKEALNNIIKHAHATTASLSFSIVNGVLITEVTDDGIGINPNQVNKFGNGLNSMKNRLNKFGGTMNIAVTGGTKLTFTVGI